MFKLPSFFLGAPDIIANIKSEQSTTFEIPISFIESLSFLDFLKFNINFFNRAYI